MICPCCGKHKKPADLASLGTALKPAMELIAVARKPLSEGTVAANVLRWGTGALNIGACRVETADDLNGGAYAKVGGRAESQSLHGGSGMNVAAKTVGKEFEQPLGRWPANLIHDGSDEVLAGFPESSPAKSGGVAGWQKDGYVGGKYEPIERTGYDDNGGSAARFFYCAKADADDRIGSKHPTVKPVDLMAYLVRLVTRKGGTVLDPFAGSGTVGEAAMREGCKAVLIEREPTYYADIQNRMKLVLAGPEERARAIVKASGKLEPADSLPLFKSEAAE